MLHPHVFPIQIGPSGLVPQVFVQAIMPPQPSDTMPHSMPAQATAMVMGVQHAFVWQT